MAPIASLVVRVSAQISELQKSFTDSTKAVEDFKSSFDKQAASIQGSIDGISKTFEQFGSVVGTIAVAAVGVTAGIAAIKVAFDGVSTVVTGTARAFQDAVSHTVELGDSLFTLSQKTGLSVESLSAFKFVAAQTGTSLDTITGAVFKLETNLGSGAKNTAAALKDLGLSLADLKKQDAAEAFATVVARLGEIPDVSKRAAAGVAIFGKAFKDIAQLPQEDLKALIQQAKDLGLVLRTETAVAADRLGDAMGALRGAFEGLQLQIGAKVLPALVAIAETFGGVFIDAITAASKGSKGLGDVFDTLVVQIGKAIGRGIEVLAKFVDAVAAWAVEVSKRIAQEAKDFLDLAPAIIAVGRALDLALSGGTHESGFDAVAGAIEKLRAPLKTVAEAAEAAGNKIREIAKGVAPAAAAAGANFATTYTRIQGEITAAAEKMRQSTGVMGEGLTKVDKAAKETKTDLNFVWKEVEELNQRVQKFDTAAMQREFKELAREAKADIDAIDKRVQRFQESTDEAAKRMQQQLFELNIPLTGGVGMGFNGIGFSQGFIQSMGLVVQPAAEKATTPFRDAFTKLGEDLPGIIFGALQGGGSVTGSVASAIAAQFSAAYQKALERSNTEFGKKISAGERAMGLAGAAISTAFVGFELGQQLGKGKGALAGAGAGALAGTMIMPGIGTAIGAGVGALAGYFGGRSADKKMAEQLAANKQALLQQFGGMQKLTELAAKLGVNIQAAFDAKKPEQFQKAVDSLNTALEAQQKRLAGINTALAAVNRRAQDFAAQFAGLDTEKLQEVAQRTQPEFERLGLFIRDTFAALVKETGNAFDALTQLAPAFQTLKSGITDFGLTSTAVIDSLVASFDLVNNDAFKPFFENIQATGQLLQGLFDAKALSPDTFQAAAADIGQSIQEIINRGGDMAKTIALSAPQLQLLWEAQQKYGAITDQTTQSILDQAVAQGVVGAQFKSVNEKILDVLLAIAKVLGADIPDALKGLGAAANSAAGAVSDGLSKIKVPDITIGVGFDVDDLDIKFEGGGGIKKMAAGGVVTRPTLALVGEAGPEAVIPLSRLGPAPAGVGRGGDVYLDGRKVGKVMLKHVADEAMYQGLVPR